MTDTSLHDRLRVFVYTHLAEHGQPPTSEQIGAAFDMRAGEARLALAGLAKRRAVILHPETGEIWMAGPFSAVPTRFRVKGAHTAWWANCAWDMLGIPAFLRQSVLVSASCADCDAQMELEVDAEHGPRAADAIVHLLLPARRWYENIGFT